MCVFFFFKQKTAYEMRISDWSSDVCSSDLLRKLCVGVESVEQLQEWQARRLKRGERLRHDTRMMPTRRAEILDGGSLYWIVKGLMLVRQPKIGRASCRERGCQYV